jgi:ABC-type antimicrobial peptide transport system permease subunit
MVSLIGFLLGFGLSGIFINTMVFSFATLTYSQLVHFWLSVFFVILGIILASYMVSSDYIASFNKNNEDGNYSQKN